MMVDLRKKMAEDREVLDKFIQLRSELITRLRAGHRGLSYAAKGSGSTSVAVVQRQTEELLPPPPDVLPFEEYAEKFDIHQMKSRGHPPAHECECTHNPSSCFT